MNPIRDQISIGFQVVVFLLIWIILLLIKGASLEIGLEAIKALPDAIGIYAILLFLFIKWAWRWRLFRGWLVNIPILHGTWKGQLQTTWRDPKTDEVPGPVAIYVTIRQTYHSVHVTMFTKESVSQSEAANTCLEEEKGIRLLSYSYANVPNAEVRDRSQIHYGAARLRIILKPEPALEGEYWTDRMSTGHIKLSYFSCELAEQYPASTSVSQ